MARARTHTPDLWAASDVEVRRVQPYQAAKTYRCPGCGGLIPPGTGHLVAVPADAELRRHWHHACWRNRSTRRPR